MCLIVTLGVVMIGVETAAHPLHRPDGPIDGPSLMITRDAISLSQLRRPDWSKLWQRRRGYRVMRLEDGLMGSSRQRPMKIAALIERFERVQLQRAQRNQSRDQGINIMTAADVPARTVAHVLYALAQAEFSFIVHLSPNDLNQPKGLKIVFPSMRHGVCQRPERQSGDLRERFSAFLKWTPTGVEVSLQGVNRCAGVHGAVGADPPDHLVAGQRTQECEPVPLRLDGACPAVPRAQGHIADERVTELAQRVCAGGRQSRWLTTLLVDFNFDELLQAAIQIFTVCQQRMVWMMAPELDEDHCARAQSFDQLDRRFKANWCTQTPF